MHRGVLIVLALGLVSNLYAIVPEKNAGDTVKAVNLNSAVVTANKTRVNRSSVPITVSVIERDEIERSGFTSLLPVLSQNIPGLFVTQKGVTGFGISSGSAGEINIRGVGQGNKVLMLLDGQPQWAGVFRPLHR